MFKGSLKNFNIDIIHLPSCFFFLVFFSFFLQTHNFLTTKGILYW